MRTLSIRRSASAAIAALAVAAGGAYAQRGAPDGEWLAYSSDAASSKYSALDQIDKSNVARLAVAWRRPSLDAAVLAQAPDMRAGKQFRGTPLKIDGVLYAPNAVGFVEAFDPGTGKTIWVEPPLEQGPNGYRGASTRGIAYWSNLGGSNSGGPNSGGSTSGGASSSPRPGDGGGDARILVQHTEYLLALDPKTGKPIPIVRHERPRVPFRGHGPRHALHVDRRTARHRRRGRARHVAIRRVPEQGSHAQRRARVRRAHRQAPLDNST